jgi:hypothetical protein
VAQDFVGNRALGINAVLAVRGPLHLMIRTQTTPSPHTNTHMSTSGELDTIAHAVAEFRYYSSAQHSAAQQP